MNLTLPFVFDFKDVAFLIIQGAKYFALEKSMHVNDLKELDSVSDYS
jgi:hypothetical protein